MKLELPNYSHDITITSKHYLPDTCTSLSFPNLPESTLTERSINIVGFNDLKKKHRSGFYFHREGEREKATD